MTVHRIDTAPLPERAPTRAGRWKMLGVLAVCAAPVLASYFTYYVVRPEGRTNYSQLINPPRVMPADLQVRDLAGGTQPVTSLKGQWLVVVASPSSCDAVCEKQLWLQRQLRQTLGREKDRVENIFLVTDDAPLAGPLQTALQADPSLRVLRVPEAQLRPWLEPAAGKSWAEHLYLVDPLGNWMMRTPPQPEPGRVKKDLEKLLRASSSWDQAGRP